MTTSMRSAQKLLSLGLIIVLFASSLMGEAAASTPFLDGPYKISPDRIQAGKTRDVAITTETGDLTSVEPEPPPSGSGVTFEAVSGQTTLHPNDKTIMVRVKVAEDADRGTVPISLIKREQDKPPQVVGFVSLEITEFRPTKIERGPTPDDIDFEVDAMWTVIPYKVVKANFGRKAADSFYAVEIFLGNNTGFDLQVVGVGFETSRERRTIDKYGVPLAFLSNDKGVPVTDEYGNRFIEAVDNNGDRIIKDGKPTYRIFRKFQLPTTDHRLVRGTIELDQLYGRRALVLNLIGGIGTLVSGFIPFFHSPNPKANFSTFSSIINGQLKEGFAIAAPDLTVNQLNRLENVVLHEGLTVLNNSQVRTIVFFPRHIVGLNKAERGDMEKNGYLWPVLEKLGELIIVGKPIITYRNREIVATKPQPPAQPATPPAIGAPAAINFSTPNGTAGGDTITVTGINFVPESQVTFNGVPAEDVKFITSTQLNVVVPTGAISGPIRVTTSSGSADSGVKRFVAHPRIERIDPPIAVPGKAITIEGKNLDTVTAVNFGTVPQTTFREKNKDKIVLDVPPNAESGIKVIAKDVGEATVAAVAAQPILEPLQKKEGKAGDRITITGKNLTNAQVFFGDAPAEVISPGANSIEVRVPKNAASGPILVRTGAGLEMKTEDFKFFPAPLIVNFSVNGSAPLTEVAVKAGDQVVISGQNLKGALIKFGEREVTPTSSEDNKITFTVPEGLPEGKITIVTPGGDVSPEKFTYKPAPIITTFSVNGGTAEAEASGKADDTVVISGENLGGLTAVKFGETTVQFTNANEKQFTVRVPPSLPAGKIKIEITTAGGKATSEKFTITQ